MKNVLMLIAVLMLAMPALASVTISCVNNNNCTFSINYTSTETGNVRAFALNVSVDGGQTITAGSNWNASYNVCPGSYVSSSNLGTPICNGSKYPGTLGGTGTSGVTLEMASLYAPGNSAPAKSGTLCTITVSGACNVTLAANTIRGGSVIMEDPTLTPAVTLNGVAVTCAPAGCQTCKGDLDGDGWVTLDDLTIMTVALKATKPDYYFENLGWNLCADMDSDDWITLDDLTQITVALKATKPDYYFECP